MPRPVSRLIQRDNGESMVAAQRVVRERQLGVLWRDTADLVARLLDRRQMAVPRDNVWRQRGQFTFDAHADELVDFLRAVMGERR